MTFRVNPIGYLHNDFTRRIPEGWENQLARIVLDECYLPALMGIEDFSHLIIVFWLNRIPRRGIELQTHPQGRKDLPRVGIFATRTPWRPNPIGLQVVELLGCEANVLTIRGIDALNDTPILDVKPYLRRGDCVAETRIPAWLERLWEQRSGQDDEQES